MKYAIGYFSLFALVVAGLMLALDLLAPGLLPGREEQGRMIYLLLWLVLIGGGAIGSSRADLGLALKQAISWLAIFLFVILAYSYRMEFRQLSSRVFAEISPASPIVPEEELASAGGLSVALRKGNDGHFHANAKVNGTHVPFLVDTGASSIALSIKDARRIGLKSSALEYNIPISTASGQTYGARIVLDKVSIGRIQLRNVDAIVIKEGLDTSLLGMSFLGRLQKFEASRNQLILRK